MYSTITTFLILYELERLNILVNYSYTDSFQLYNFEEICYAVQVKKVL